MHLTQKHQECGDTHTHTHTHTHTQVHSSPASHPHNRPCHYGAEPVSLKHSALSAFKGQLTSHNIVRLASYLEKQSTLFMCDFERDESTDRNRRRGSLLCFSLLIPAVIIRLLNSARAFFTVIMGAIVVRSLAAPHKVQRTHKGSMSPTHSTECTMKYCHLSCS